MKYLLDTDHISILQRQSVSEFSALITYIAQLSSEDLAISIISFHEQIMGCHAYINHARSSSDVVRGYSMLARILKTFSVATVLPFDASAGAVFDRLLAQRIRVATMDLRIASIALSHDMILVTRNERDFCKIPGLNIEDWTVIKAD